MLSPRIRFFILTAVFFCLAAWMKQFSIVLAGFDFKIPAIFSFSGCIFLLLTWSLKNRNSLFSLPPVFLSLKLAGILLHYLDLIPLAVPLSNAGSLFWPLAGILLFRSALISGKKFPFHFFALAGLSVLLMLSVLNEYRIYLPEVPFRILLLIFLGIYFFLILLLLYPVSLKERGMPAEQQYADWGLLIISVKFFQDFILV